MRSALALMLIVLPHSMLRHTLLHPRMKWLSCDLESCHLDALRALTLNCVAARRGHLSHTCSGLAASRQRQGSARDRSSGAPGLLGGLGAVGINPLDASGGEGVVKAGRRKGRKDRDLDKSLDSLSIFRRSHMGRLGLFDEEVLAEQVEAEGGPPDSSAAAVVMPSRRAARHQDAYYAVQAAVSPLPTPQDMHEEPSPTATQAQPPALQDQLPPSRHGQPETAASSAATGMDADITPEQLAVYAGEEEVVGVRRAGESSVGDSSLQAEAAEAEVKVLARPQVCVFVRLRVCS